MIEFQLSTIFEYYFGFPAWLDFIIHSTKNECSNLFNFWLLVTLEVVIPSVEPELPILKSTKIYSEIFEDKTLISVAPIIAKTTPCWNPFLQVIHLVNFHWNGRAEIECLSDPPNSPLNLWWNVQIKLQWPLWNMKYHGSHYRPTWRKRQREYPPEVSSPTWCQLYI